MTEPTEASALSGTGTTVEFSGERLEIQPLRFGQVLEIIAVAAPLVDAIASQGVAVGSDENDLAFFMQLVSRHHQEVPRVLALAVRRDVDFIAEGQLDEVVALLAAVYEVNRSFFDQRLAPAVQGLVEKWRSRGSGDGSTPPSS